MQSKDCREYQKELQIYLEKSLKFIGNLKENNCDKWRYAWCECGKNVFNIGKDLAEKNNDVCLKFLRIFVKYSIEFENYNSTILKNYHSCALIEIAKIYFHQKKNYEKSLVTTAFNILISHEHRTRIVLNWLKYKADCRNFDILNNTSIQELTIPTILEKYKHEILYYDHGFQLTKQQKIELLIIELHNYKENWKSKIPMMVTFKELYEINDNIVELVDVFIEIWGNGDLNIHENLSKLLPLIIKNYQQFTINSIDNKIKLAHLYYLQHKYCLKDAIMETTDDMNKTINLNITTPINPDPNEQCDTVSSYTNLKLNRYNKIMKELNKSLDILTGIIESEIELIQYDKIYFLLKKIGHEYRLHSNLIKSIQTWYLALKIANFNNNNLEIIESTGCLIELSDIKQSAIIEEFINKADEIAGNLDVNQYLNELITYYLCKCSCYYKCDIEKAYQIFCGKIQKFSNNFNDNYLMKARISLLNHKFLVLPCKYRINGHRDLSKIHQAYKEVVQHYYSGCTNNDSTYEMCLFFEITEELAQMYHNLRMPRELRCYCKEIVLVTQKLLLPYRTLILLYYLSYADIISLRLDDCKVKINGISDILCLQTKLTTPMKKQLQQQQHNYTEIIDKLTIEFNEIMLDAPIQTTKQQQQHSPSSPNLQIQTFQLPSFFYHQPNCECFQCDQSVEFLQFLLKKTLLDLLLNVYQKNTIIARDYCCGGLKIFELIRNKQQEISRNHIPTCLLPNSINLNLKTYCTILMEYGNICLRANEIDKSIKINEKLLTQLLNHQLNNEYLINEALMQKLNILTISSLSSIKTNVKINHLTIDNNDGPKTPESRQNQVTIPFKSTPQCSPSPLPQKPIRTIQFNLDDDDDDDNDNNDKRKKMVKSQIYNRLFDEAKTPAPSTSKNRLYRTRSTTKKQNLEESNQESSSCSSVVQMSPDAYTPNIKQKIHTNLTNRTKLLTERLRSSKKENSTNNNNEKIVKKTTKKLRYN